ncbi:MAG: hypothetical protein ABL864_15545 [Terricaulis sp.]
MKNSWPTKEVKVSGLQLDAKNPRLGRNPATMSPRDIINHLFKHDKAGEVAESIARGGYFSNEPLLAVREGGKLVVVEGNRRLAALKGLTEPALVEGPWARKLTRLAAEMGGTEDIAAVPVTTAPSRRDTDKQVASRHIGTPVLAWEAENRAGFILEKLAEGYTAEQLRRNLGFSDSDIQQARTTKAVADMARAIQLPSEVKVKVAQPRAKIFSTIERVLVSAPGKKFFRLEPSVEHGIVGGTTKDSFVGAFTRLVTDIALNKQSSRSLNTSVEIEAYLNAYPNGLKPKKGGAFTPSEFGGKSVPLSAHKEEASKERGRTAYKGVVPRTFKIGVQHDKLIDMRTELIQLDRSKYPNAGAFLLRAFLEVAAVDFLSRTGELGQIVADLKERGGRLQGGAPSMREMVPTLLKHAKAQLAQAQADSVEKAITYNKTAPFTISDLHSFVHQPHELPTERDILQFWKRVEPLMKYMLSDYMQSAAKAKTGGKS